MTRLVAALCVLIIWAGIYLPSLGSTEIKGEEGRRIMPALAMIESGDWIVPQLSGEEYLRKPPLINWVIALSMETTGRRDEWAARLPTVLGVLALGLFTVLATARWLRPEGAMMAAIFAIGSISLIEKGRLAEIEGLYVAFTGMAMIWWMRGFRLEANRWSTWLLCGFFLGLGLLTKGPLHLLFFYALVVGVCWQQRSARDFFNLPHLAGLLVAAGIFALWMIPHLNATQSGAAAATWQEQFVARITDNRFDVESWLLALPRGLGNFLPWVVLTPLLWHRTLSHSLPLRERTLLRGGRNALVALYLVMLVIPGVLERYTMPILPAIGVLLALVLRDRVPTAVASGWRGTLVLMTAVLAIGCIAAPFVGGWSLGGSVAASFGLFLCMLAWRGARGETGVALTGATAVLMIVITLIYSVAVVPRMVAGDDVRPVGRAISARIPEGEVLHVVRVGYQPELFYLTVPVRYHADWDVMPAEAEWVLFRSKHLKDAKRARPGLDELESFPVKLDRPLLLMREEGRGI